jgi:hypothetical protein
MQNTLDESVYDAADRALSVLDRMVYTDDGVEQAETYLETAREAADVTTAYDEVNRAHTMLASCERGLLEQPLDDPADTLRLRNAVATLERHVTDTSYE